MKSWVVKGKFLNVRLVLALILSALCMSVCAQSYMMYNKDEMIKVSVKKDSLFVELTNESYNQVIFMPIQNPVKQGWSDDKTTCFIELGIDLKPFNEFGIYELDIIRPRKSRVYALKLSRNITDTKIYFEFQFYMREEKRKKFKKTIYNTDIRKEKKWLERGDWEWGTFIIN